MLDVILCAAIAMLLLTLIWCLIGRLLLPMRAEARMVFFLAGREAALERQVRAVNWLRCSGLLDGTLLRVPTEAGAPAAGADEAFARPWVSCEGGP